MSRRNISTPQDFDLGPCSSSILPPEPECSRPHSAVVRAARSKLEAIYRTDVIPRLVAAHRGRNIVVTQVEPQAGLFEKANEFARILISRPSHDVIAYVDDLLQTGADLEWVFACLVPATAQRLGIMWDLDLCDFFEVAHGTGQLQHVIRHFDCDFCGKSQDRVAPYRILLAVLPGNTHTLGLSLVREQFCRHGWIVDCAQPASMAELASLAAAQRFDAIGLSAGSDFDTDALKLDIAALRKRSNNRRVLILVGGQPFVQRPTLAVEVGADVTAMDGQQAVDVLSRRLESSAKVVR